MKSKMIMNSIVLKEITTMTRYSAYALAFSLVLILSSVSQTQAQAAKADGPKAFATAAEAVDAIIAATETFDENALAVILGSANSDLYHTGEPVADRAVLSEFARLGREKKTIITDKKNPNRAFVQVGDEDWPCPIPLVRKGGKWYFDAAAGRQELLFRRIGRNELDAIQICRGFVEAQHEYALQKHDGAPVNQYAQHIISTVGKQDGLAWRKPDGTWDGPVGENIAKVIEQGYSEKATPFHGYYFKVLKGQGPAAPMGTMNFVVNGYMIGGFALIAFPSQYNVTGVKTFMVSHDGVVYEKNLGPNTLESAKGIELFNPDKTWTPVLKDE